MNSNLKLLALSLLFSAMSVFAQSPTASRWQPMIGGGIRGDAGAIAKFGSDLYIGGTLSCAAYRQGESCQAAQNIVIYNLETNQWDTTISANGRVRDILVVGVDIYFVGSFTQIGGVAATGAARYTPASGTWQQLGPSGLSGRPYRIIQSGQDLYVNGSFSGADNVLSRHVIGYHLASNEWFGLDTGVSGGLGDVTSVAAVGSDLYVSGNFAFVGSLRLEASGNAIYNIATKAWRTIPDTGIGSAVLRSPNVVRVHAGDVFLAGWSNALEIKASGVRVAHAMSNDQASGMLVTADRVYSSSMRVLDRDTRQIRTTGTGLSGQIQSAYGIVEDGKYLYVAGSFDFVDGVRVDNIARYQAKGDLSVARTGSKRGKITSSVGGIDCGETCTTQQPWDKQITLTATPTPPATFAGWSGGGCTGTGTCVINLQEDTTVTALFNHPTTPQITLPTGNAVIGRPYSVNVKVLAGPEDKPTGTVALTSTDGGGSCTATLTNGEGACTLTPTSTGSKTLTATYAGTTGFPASSTTAELTVDQPIAATTTTLSADRATSMQGEGVTFTATVSGANPTGAVAFKAGEIVIAGCEAKALNGSGNSRSATCATSALAVGTHNLTATYGGDASNATSTSAAVQHVVQPLAATTTTLSADRANSMQGEGVTFTATVNGANPTGAVAFKAGENVIAGCEAKALNGSGNSRSATCSTSGLPVADHSITAVYGGDASNAASISAAVQHTVQALAAEVAVRIIRIAPATTLVGAGEGAAVEYGVEATNRTAEAAQIVFNVAAKRGLNQPLWDCTASNVDCSPVMGSGAAEVSVANLPANGTATLRLTGLLKLADRFVEVQADTRVNGVSRPLYRVDPVAPDAIFRAGFD